MVLKEVFGDWYIPLQNMIDSEYFKTIPNKLGKNYTPEKENIFKAFTLTPLESVRVIIIGQNPYPTKGHAIGVSFGVPDTLLHLPKSLNNIIKELESDYDTITLNFDCTLESWAKQGVFMLNTALTTKIGEVNNVHGELWEPFITEVFKVLQEKHTGLVFILWGKEAQKYKTKINQYQYIIESAHPSPMSAHRGFFGSKPFSKTNEILQNINNYKIKWL